MWFWQAMWASVREVYLLMASSSISTEVLPAFCKPPVRTLALMSSIIDLEISRKCLRGCWVLFCFSLIQIGNSRGNLTSNRDKRILVFLKWVFLQCKSQLRWIARYFHNFSWNSVGILAIWLQRQRPGLCEMIWRTIFRHRLCCTCFCGFPYHTLEYNSVGRIIVAESGTNCYPYDSYRESSDCVTLPRFPWLFAVQGDVIKGFNQASYQARLKRLPGWLLRREAVQNKAVAVSQVSHRGNNRSRWLFLVAVEFARSKVPCGSMCGNQGARK